MHRIIALAKKELSDKKRKRDQTRARKLMGIGGAYKRGNETFHPNDISTEGNFIPNVFRTAI